LRFYRFQADLNEAAGAAAERDVRGH
jgi:hypothetical protein